MLHCLGTHQDDWADFEADFGDVSLLEALKESSAGCAILKPMRSWFPQKSMSDLANSKGATKCDPKSKFNELVPCPDCGYTDHPGTYIGADSVSDCDTCAGTSKVDRDQIAPKAETHHG